jgi:hypothetical protein
MSDPPIDNVPIEERIDIDWAIEMIRSRFPNCRFYERGDGRVLSCELRVVVDGGHTLRPATDAELHDILFWEQDEPQYLDEVVRRSHAHQLLEEIDTFLRDQHLQSLSPGELVQRLLDGIPTEDELADLSSDGQARVISNASQFARELKKYEPFLHTVLGGYRTVTQVVEAGESRQVEFKATSRFNLKANKPTPEIEDAVVKSVAAFLNTEGGTLLIGVDDDGSIRGISEDLNLFAGSMDRYLNWLNSLFTLSLGGNAASTVRAAMEDGVCRVDVTPFGEPVFAKVSSGSQEFYVRVGNSTRALSREDQDGYVRRHFPRSHGA